MSTAEAPWLPANASRKDVLHAVTFVLSRCGWKYAVDREGEVVVAFHEDNFFGVVFFVSSSGRQESPHQCEWHDVSRHANHLLVDSTSERWRVFLDMVAGGTDGFRLQLMHALLRSQRHPRRHRTQNAP